MQTEYKRDVVVIMASLFGIVAGHELRKLRSPEALPAEPAPAQEAAKASAKDPLIGVSSLFAASTLALRVGDQLHVERDNLAAQAALAFGISAGLTYYTSTLRKYIPGLKG